MMKIALSVKGAGLGAWLDDDFANCGHIIVVGEDNRFTSWPNPYRISPKSNELLLAEKVITENVDALVTGGISQEIQVKMEEAGIQVVIREHGTVFDLVEEVRNKH